MDDLHIEDATPDHAFGKARGAVFYVWRGRTTVEAARALGEVVASLRAASGQVPGVLLGVVEAGTPPPDGETRKALAATLESGAGLVRASALVFEGQGFQASMVRMVATGLAMVARPPFPHQVFADVGSATDWLAQQVADDGVASHAAQALQDHLARLRAAAPP